jgi:hypothetical protein
MGVFAHTESNLLFDPARFKENCFSSPKRAGDGERKPIATEKAVVLSAPWIFYRLSSGTKRVNQDSLGVVN